MNNSVPALVEGKGRNGGSLYAGGVPGNRGSTGRPRNELREMFRSSAAKGIEELNRILDVSSDVTITCECGRVHTVKPNPADDTKLRALDVAAKYGVGTQQEIDQAEHVTVVIDPRLLPEWQDHEEIMAEEGS